MLIKNVYITATGSFLPNQPVENEEIENYPGRIGGVPPRMKAVFLRKNGIKRRYYVPDTQQNTTHLAYQMTALAVKNCLSSSSVNNSGVALLSATTTQSNLQIPGFASIAQAKCALMGEVV